MSSFITEQLWGERKLAATPWVRLLSANLPRPWTETVWVRIGAMRLERNTLPFQTGEDENRAVLMRLWETKESAGNVS